VSPGSADDDLPAARLWGRRCHLLTVCSFEET